MAFDSIPTIVIIRMIINRISSFVVNSLDLIARTARASRTPDSPPPLRRAPAALARRFQQICATVIAETLAGSSLTQLQYAMLVFLDDEPGIDQRRLAEALGIDRNNTSVIVDQLAHMKLLDRRINGADRRARALYITERGRKLWRSLHPKLRRANQRILAPLDAHERELFLDLFVRLIEANRIHARPGAGRRKRTTRLNNSG